MGKKQTYGLEPQNISLAENRKHFLIASDVERR